MALAYLVDNFDDYFSYCDDDGDGVCGYDDHSHHVLDLFLECFLT